MPRYFFPRPARAGLLDQLREQAGIDPVTPEGTAVLELDETGCWVTCDAEQFDAVATVIAAHDPQRIDALAVARDTQRLLARDKIIATVRSAEGKALTALTIAERNALLAVLLWRFGALTPDLTVANVGLWADGVG